MTALFGAPRPPPPPNAKAHRSFNHHLSRHPPRPLVAQVALLRLRPRPPPAFSTVLILFGPHAAGGAGTTLVPRSLAPSLLPFLPSSSSSSADSAVGYLAPLRTRLLCCCRPLPPSQKNWFLRQIVHANQVSWAIWVLYIKTYFY